MNGAARSMRALAALTFLETLRQPVTLLLLLALILAAVFLPMITSHTLGETDRVIADAMLALHLLIGMLLGGFAACHSLSGEIRRGTAATVLVKPVGRAVFFLGKFAGIAGVLAGFSLTATAAGLIARRAVIEPYTVDLWAALPLLLGLAAAFALAGAINFFTRRPFVSDAVRLVVLFALLAFTVTGFVSSEGRGQTFGAGYSWSFAAASLLVGMAALTLSALALTLASRLDAVPTVSICAVIVLIGMMSDYLLGRHAAVSRLAALLYAIVPNWQHFWLADALHLEEPIPAAYLGAAAAYAGLYLLGVLGLGIVFFRHTEVKS